MIIYQSTKDKFLADILGNRIEQTLAKTLLLKTGKRVGKQEELSWKESLRFMGAVLHDHDIPAESGISIEYHIPQTSKRVDFIITGQDEAGKDSAILIELKQWSEIVPTKKDGIVITRFKHGQAETSHPSYQAWSYCTLIQGFNETVYTEGINLVPCAYLHNYAQPGSPILNEHYASYIEKAPLFLGGEDEQERLRSFIKRHVRHGDNRNILYRIDSGKIKPSKTMVESLANMLKGKSEFVMIDDQKVVYEKALELSHQAANGKKQVLIVEGGPGTGKTVLAINLLVELTKRSLNARYVTKNAAPRTVYESKLTGTLKKTEFSNFFSGSGSFTETPADEFDALIIDEAHRLNEKSGMYKNLGENQIKELINAARFSIFFIDEDQRVTWSDIGSQENIRQWAKESDADVHVAQLESQFRCNGSDGYISWLDNVLGIRPTANLAIQELDYDFRVVDSPHKLRALIEEKNQERNSARIVAGYCWNWISKKDPEAFDIVLPEHNFAMKWNLASDGNLWILKPESVKEAGCIHTCQGLEVDYVGVIIGDDFVVRDGEIVTQPKARATTDKSLQGFKQALAENPAAATHKADTIIKNTYRTLMSRGMKGCFIYCTDEETQAYFKDLLSVAKQETSDAIEEIEDFDFAEL